MANLSLCKVEVMALLGNNPTPRPNNKHQFIYSQMYGTITLFDLYLVFQCNASTTEEEDIEMEEHTTGIGEKKNRVMNSDKETKGGQCREEYVISV